MPNDDLPIIEDIFRKFLAGYSIRSLISVLEKTNQYQEGNYVRPNGTTVKNILRNSIYAGIRTFGVRGVGKHNQVAGVRRTSLSQSALVQADSYQEYSPEGFESIISIDEYNEVQNLLDRNSKAFKKYPDRQRHKYSGLLRCSHCNTPLVASTWRNPKNDEVRITYTCPTSGNGTEHCKEGDAPFRKAIRTDELDQMISKQLGIIMMDKGFHLRNCEEVLRRMELRSDSSIAAVEEDLEIQQKRLDEIWEMWESSGSPALKEKLDQQTRKIDQLKQKVSEVVQEDELLEFAHAQFQQMRGAAGHFQQYFGTVYMGVANVMRLEHPDDRKKMLDSVVETLTEKWTEVLHDSLEPLRKKFGNPELEWEDLEGFSLKGDDDLYMQTLRAIGLDHIKVSWELGIWRGKPRRVPTELLFAFSLTPQEQMDKDLLLISKRCATLSSR